MPAGVRWFAAHQPFTPIIETVRALLSGTAPGHHLPVALGWCAVIGAVAYLRARARFKRRRSI
jgi:ABC-2 type transport system permease protein